ncbi:MAG: pyridoxal 5'-phosphate synthase glutaminase subunit PdxT [Candidatus Altiarchaeota archaeon]
MKESSIGVLSVQGDVSEHVSAMRVVCKASGFDAKVSEVKTSKSLAAVDALVFPGGESTTMGKLLREFGLEGELVERVSSGMPCLATCAGLVLLAKEGDLQVEKTHQPLLGVLDIKVSRNAFGRQRESFEADLDIPVLGKKPYCGVFIRAPAVDKLWGKAKSLCEYGGRIVAVRQGKIIATSFHPELSMDGRLHEYFLNLI